MSDLRLLVLGACIAAVAFGLSSAALYGVEPSTGPALQAAAKDQSAVESGRPPSTDEIVSAWKRREELTRSSVFKWFERRVVLQNLLAEDESLAEPASTDYTVSSRLSFDRDLLRYTFKKSIWNVAAPEGGDEYVGVFNGKESKVYFPPGYVKEYPRGHVSSQKRSEELTSCYVKPFLWTFRPFAPGSLLFPLGDATLLTDKMPIDGRDGNYLVFAYSPTSGQQDSIYIDPQQGYSIVRQTSTVEDRLRFQFDISYEFDSANKLWIPSSWRYQSNDGNGKVRFSVDGKLIDHQINPPLPPSEFEFQFPAGTWVHDGANTEYLVQANGPNIPVARSERGRPYLDLLRGSGFSPNAAQWLFWANVALLLIISAFLFLRWQQWKRSVPH